MLPWSPTQPAVPRQPATVACQSLIPHRPDAQTRASNSVLRRGIACPAVPGRSEQGAPGSARGRRAPPQGEGLRPPAGSGEGAAARPCCGRCGCTSCILSSGLRRPPCSCAALQCCTPGYLTAPKQGDPWLYTLFLHCQSRSHCCVWICIEQTARYMQVLTALRPGSMTAQAVCESGGARACGGAGGA